MWPLRDDPSRVTSNLALQNTQSVHLAPSISLSFFIYLSVIAFTFFLTLALMPLCLNQRHPLPFVCCFHLPVYHLSSPPQCVVWTAEGSRECAWPPPRGVDRLVSFHLLASLHSWMTYGLLTDWQRGRIYCLWIHCEENIWLCPEAFLSLCTPLHTQQAFDGMWCAGEVQCQVKWLQNSLEMSLWCG